MKNILKKLGIFGLIVAVLLPFLELPVNATSGNCESYLQNYLFMDIKSSWTTWDTYIKGGYTTFTSFLYELPKLNDDQTLTIEAVSSNYLNSKDDLRKFYDAYVTLVTDENVNKKDLGIYGNYINSGNSDNVISSNLGDYKEVTHLLHGMWARYNESGKEEVDYTLNEEIFSGNNDGFNKFFEQTFQGGLLANGHGEYIDSLKTQIGGASFVTNSTYSNGQYTLDSYYQTNSRLVEYFQKIYDDVNAGGNTASWQKNYIFPGEEENEIYLNLSIKRQIDNSSINKLTFGFKNDTNDEDAPAYYIYSKTSNVDLEENSDYDTADLNSYDAWNLQKKCAYLSTDGSIDDSMTYDQDSSKNPVCYLIPSDKAPDIRTNDSIGFYIPHVIGVKYSICNNSNSNTWKLIYNANTDDTNVTKVPATKTQNIGEKATVDAGPSRTGYKFNGWCTDKDGKTTNNCYAVGSEIGSTTGDDIVLYAQWLETGAGDDVKTGIATYILAFGAVGIITAGIYLVVKKKNLFRQI